MIHIQSKQDLYDQVKDNLKHPVVIRAFHSGTVELLGGFEHIPPLNGPGWIMRVRSTHKHYYYIAAVVCGFKIMMCHLAPPLPWKYWIGEGSSNKLMFGDRPYLYRRLKRWTK